jgi:hypothetical protein
VGLRRYTTFRPGLQGYGEGTIGLAFIDETDVVLVSPQANLAERATDFYDKSSAFTLGVNVGLLFEMSERVGAFSQLGFRYVSGMSEIDGLVGTGLETINDKSGRWTLPFVFGVRARF